MDYLHTRQVVHRDLKPSNILITADGHSVKLIDFGVSDTASHAIFKGPAGTRKYAAPEMLNGGAIDARTDLYSLGVIAEEMNQALPHPDRRLHTIASRCIQSNPNDRPDRATQVSEMLNHSLRNKMMWWLMSGLILCMVMVLWQWRETSPTVHETPSGSNRIDSAHIASPIMPTVEEESHEHQPTSATTIPSNDKVADTHEQAQTIDNKATLPRHLRQMALSKAQSAALTEVAKWTNDTTTKHLSQEALEASKSILIEEIVPASAEAAVHHLFGTLDPKTSALKHYLASSDGQQLLRDARKAATETAQRALSQ